MLWATFLSKNIYVYLKPMRPEATEFGEITKNNITPFNVIQGHRFWYQSKDHNTTSY